MSSKSSASRDTDAQTSGCFKYLYWPFVQISAIWPAFQCAMVVKRRAGPLSHWIVDTIKAAYTSQGLECPLHIRAHSTRAIIKRYVYSGYMLSSRLVFSEYLRQVLQAGRSVLSLPSAVGEWLIHVLLPLFVGVAARTVITLRSPLWYCCCLPWIQCSLHCRLILSCSQRSPLYHWPDMQI